MTLQFEEEGDARSTTAVKRRSNRLFECFFILGKAAFESQMLTSSLATLPPFHSNRVLYCSKPSSNTLNVGAPTFPARIGWQEVGEPRYFQVRWIALGTACGCGCRYIQ